MLSCNGQSQEVEYAPVQRIAVLSHNIKETSGLEDADTSSLYTENDGGSGSYLYRISKFTGDILQVVDIQNGKNNDWEDLGGDEDYVYIGDFGNNRGDRHDLRVLKFSRSALLLDKKPEPQKIKFTYPDQDSFKPRNKHDFDCEALIALGDSLYIFTKNRASLTTTVYRLPKIPGEYVAERMGQFNTNGLVTGADIRTGDTNSLVLVGYSHVGMRYAAFIWIFTGFQGSHFFSGTRKRVEIAPHLQAEGIVWDTDSTVLITNEARPGGHADLQRVDLSAFMQ